MLRLCANISTLFTESALLDRPAAAARAGFTAIEMQFPYAVDAAALARARAQAGLQFVLINAPPGSLAGELGIACLPGRQRDFADSMAHAISYAKLLGCTRINCLAGNLPRGANREQCWEVLIANLRLAAGQCASEGVQLLVEVLNGSDWPDFILTHWEEGEALLDVVAHGNLKLQYDVYHRRAAGEDWLAALTRRVDRIGHIQFSDHPGRHEPGTGELDLSRFFETVADLAYDGWTGCEYWPTRHTLESLAWRDRLSQGGWTREFTYSGG